jgi:hypothetical protein
MILINLGEELATVGSSWAERLIRKRLDLKKIQKKFIVERIEKVLAFNFAKV